MGSVAARSVTWLARMGPPSVTGPVQIGAEPEVRYLPPHARVGSEGIPFCPGAQHVVEGALQDLLHRGGHRSRGRGGENFHGNTGLSGHALGPLDHARDRLAKATNAGDGRATPARAPRAQPDETCRAREETHPRQRRSQRVSFRLQLDVRELVPAPIELSYEPTELVAQHSDLALELPRALPWRENPVAPGVRVGARAHASRSLAHCASSLRVFRVAERGLVTRRLQLT